MSLLDLIAADCDSTTYQIHITTEVDQEMLKVTADGRCLARAADGQMVELALRPDEVQRLIWPPNHPAPLVYVTGVLCQILTERIPVSR